METPAFGKTTRSTVLKSRREREKSATGFTYVLGNLLAAFSPGFSLHNTISLPPRGLADRVEGALGKDLVGAQTS